MELTRTNRIQSVDILRGAVMIIMALDHTRDFFHQPAIIADPLNPAITTIPIYFTRWITHFCAPTFVFLSGVSAYLSSLRKTRAEASLFLIKRGLWLVLVEVTIVTFGITANPFFTFIVLQVIWAIGWSMVVLGILSRFSPKLVLIAGLLLFFGHNILDLVSLPKEGAGKTAMDILFRATFSIIPLDKTHVVAAVYAILPWSGVMLLGYSIGTWFNKAFPPQKRKVRLLQLGTGLMLLFIILRAINVYGDTRPWVKGDGFRFNLLAFLNTTKYPPSLLYLSMTLGPSCLALAFLENAKGRWKEVVSVYGRVPFFYYICHFYLLHLILIIAFFATGHGTSEIISPFIPFNFRPATFGWGLPIVYLIWLFVVVVLYFPCRWYSEYKKSHNNWWLSYV
jgi:uncharacterized membrane protein